MQEAVFGVGDFWIAEDGFRRLEGVLSSRVGYAGGAKAPESHEEVLSGSTGHALVARITFDPERVSFDELLSVFWNLRDDSLYLRSYRDNDPHRIVLFCANSAQQEAARHAIESLERARIFGEGVRLPVSVSLLEQFFPAARDFQRYPEQKEALDVSTS
ncbi:MAG: peptide-methionine (S)-S-oxide reductase [Myxococcales bacterium]|nr:peptide-methionine (S)-S-oxide reductase [Myxococcales bacterium]